MTHKSTNRDWDLPDNGEEQDGSYYTILDILFEQQDSDVHQIFEYLLNGKKRRVDNDEWETPVVDVEYYDGYHNGAIAYYQKFEKTYSSSGPQELLANSDIACIIGSGGTIYNGSNGSALGQYVASNTYAGLNFVVATGALTLYPGSAYDDIGHNCNIWVRYCK